MNQLITRLLKGVLPLLCALMPCLPGLAQPNSTAVTGYGYGSGYNSILNLSDGTILVAGGGTSLSWVPIGIPVDTLSIPQTRRSAADTTKFGIVSSAPGQIGYLLHLSGDFQRLIRVTAMPPGLVPDIVKIRATNLPGAASGQIYISGRRNDPNVKGYYIAKLNGNYVNNPPTAADWTFDVRSLDRRHNMGAASPFPAGVESDVRKYQPWDVGADGKVYFVLDREFSDDWCAIHRLRANGTLDVVENWRVHWTGDGTQSFNRGPSMRLTPASSYSGPGQITSSGIILKLNRNGHLRSATQAEFDSLSMDDNGNLGRKGAYPDDILFDGPLAFSAGNFAPASAGGQTGMLPNLNGGNTPTPRCVALTVDRSTGDFVFGYSVYSTSPNSSVHDFEPAVVCMDSSGRMKWWARCYQTTAQNSNAQQHIDHLAIDYYNRRVVVAGRTYGDCANNFWAGNQLSWNLGGTGFLNRFTGPSHSNYISWIGALGMTGNVIEGKILRATYVGEAADTLVGTPYANRLYNGFPNINTANVPLANTETEDLYVLEDGRVVWAGKTNRAMTTKGALHPMLKFGEGYVRPQSLVRVYSADLDTVIYSSMVATCWNELIKSSSQPLGNLRVFANQQGPDLSILAVGTQYEAGNIGLLRKPQWADSVARVQTSSAPIFAMLPVHKQNSIAAELPRPDTIFATSVPGTCAGTLDTFRVRRVPGMKSVIWSLGTGWVGFSQDTILVARSLPTTSNISYITVAYQDSFSRSKQLTIVLPAPIRTANVSQLLPRPTTNLLCVGQPFTLSSVRSGSITRFDFTSSVAGWVPQSGTDTSATYIVPALADTSAIFVRAINSCGPGAWRKLPIPRPVAKPTKPTIIDSSGFLVSSVSGGIQWYRNGSILTGSTNRRLPITTSTSGSFTVIATNRCGADTSAAFVVVGLPNSITSQLSLYPNPTNTGFVKITGDQAILQVQILNSLGQVVLVGQPNGEGELDLAGLTQGTYWLRVDGHRPMVLVNH